MARKRSTPQTTPQYPPRRLAFIADPHLGNHGRWKGLVASGLNRRCRAVLGALEQVVELAVRERCDGIVVAGDVFDVSKPIPQIIAALLRIKNSYPGLWVDIVGNHDQVSEQGGDHALGPLAHAERCLVIERPGVVFEPGSMVPLVNAVPFGVGPAAQWFDRTFEPGLPVVAHMGGIDDQTPEFLRKSNDALPVERIAEIASASGVRDVFLGNWHDPREWRIGDVSIHQLGILAPKTIAESGPEFGRVAIWDGPGKVSIHQVGGPRFEAVDSIEAFEESLRRYDSPLRCDLFVEFRAQPDTDLNEVDRRLRSAIQAQRIVDYEIVPPVAERQDIDDGIARAIAGTSSLQEAVQEWTRGQTERTVEPIPADMASPVLEAIKGYLSGRSMAVEEQ